MRILVFDLEVAGHHAGYIGHLLRYWPDAHAQLTMVVSPEFLSQHNDVVQTETRARITWCPISDQELAWYETSKRSLLRYTWAEWRLFCRYAKKAKAEQGLVMYIDRFQLPLALRLPLPCPISGIYFRPKFHYGQFASHRQAEGEQARARREQWLWRSALSRPHVRTLFCLDPFAVEPLNRLAGHKKAGHKKAAENKAVHLPDPVEIYANNAGEEERLRTRLGIESGRKVFLLFGALGQRKGIYQVLEALKGLSVEHQRQITLLLVGPVTAHDKASVASAVDSLRDHSMVQLLVNDHFMADENIQPYFEVADVVLALYQQHVGMSAILVRAATARRPVLASDYGLMGEMVGKYELGWIVDSTDIDEIAQKMVALLNPDSMGKKSMAQFDGERAAQLAALNSAERFVDVLSSNVDI